MKRNVLIGNGINIQFGGKDEYSNSAILKRMFSNMRNGKYEAILPGCTKKEQEEVFETLKNVLVDIDKYKPSEEYLFLLKEIDRVKKQYNSETSIENIGMEDFFLALEMAYKNGDTNEFKSEVEHELKMPILDAIYNDGKINEIDYGEGVKRFLSSYDNVFTVNYDSNLNSCLGAVYHLHGEFSTLAPEYDVNSAFSKEHPDKCKSSEVVAGFEHVYSNTIMSWYWLEKYGGWLGKESVYGSDAFKSMEGKLDIIGMSPCNDEHLFIMINQSKVSSIDYYYHSNDDRARMKDKIVGKPVTYKNIDKLWNRLAK